MGLDVVFWDSCGVLSATGPLVLSKSKSVTSDVAERGMCNSWSRAVISVAREFRAVFTLLGTSAGEGGPKVWVEAGRSDERPVAGDKGRGNSSSSLTALRWVAALGTSSLPQTVFLLVTSVVVTAEYCPRLLSNARLRSVLQVARV